MTASAAAGRDAALAARRDSPSDWIAQVRLAEIDVEAGVVGPESWHAAREAVALAPNQVRPHLVLGEVALISGDSVTALASFTRALTLDPRNGRARQQLSTIPETSAEAVDYISLLQQDPDSDPGLQHVADLPRVFLVNFGFLVLVIIVTSFGIFAAAGSAGPTTPSRLLMVLLALGLKVGIVASGATSLPLPLPSGTRRKTSPGVNGQRTAGNTHYCVAQEQVAEATSAVAISSRTVPAR
jgi:hypothetical protein